MRAWKGDIFGSPNIGMYVYVTDEFGLISVNAKEKIIQEFEKVFGVKFYKIMICGTDLVGIFIAGKDNKILVPANAKENEIETLNSIAEVHVIDTKLNALGNNIMIGDNAILVNPSFEKDVKEEISKIFGLPVYDFTVGKSKVVGTLIAHWRNKFLVPPIIKEPELERLRKIFNPKVLNIGSVNFGSPFLKSGLVVNSYGYAVGNLTTGHELALIDETFRY